MSDNENLHSGSRWEPAPAPPGGPENAQPASAAGQGDAPEASQQGRPGAVASRGKSSRLRGRGVLAGAAVGLLLAGGLGGFALGHATADGGTSRIEQVRNGFPGGEDGLPGGESHESHEHGFPGRQPGSEGGRGFPPGDDDDGDDDEEGMRPRLGDDGDGTAPKSPSPAPASGDEGEASAA